VKILLINWQDPANPEAGGAEIHLREIFSRIAASGHEVTWLTSGWRGADRKAALGAMEVHRTGSRYTFGLASILYYRRNLASRPFDIVVEALNKVPVYAPAWSRHPVVLLVHHLFGATAFREASPPLAAITWLLERPIPRIYTSSPVQAISESTRSDLVDRGVPPSHVTVIHPGVDLDFFRPASSPTRADTPTFLYLGRLRRYKSVDLILRALARLRADGLDAHLVIAGKGDDEARLRSITAELRLADRVHFTGYVSESDKRDLFRSSWANVFVSPKEGWGITNLEAAACGTATIASDSPGLRESVLHARTGLLVPHGDIESLASALRSLASDREMMERLGRQAIEFAARFTWDRAARLSGDHLAEAWSAARS
jgi:glycosyltransferase involved in cell wall biosynthesis